MDWPCQTPRSLHHQDSRTLDARGKAKEGPPADNVVEDGEEGNEEDGKDLERHSSHSKGPADEEGLHCCPTRHQGVMGE